VQLLGKCLKAAAENEGILNSGMRLAEEFIEPRIWDMQQTVPVDGVD
jgi:hypothetical protein